MVDIVTSRRLARTTAVLTAAVLLLAGCGRARQAASDDPGTLTPQPTTSAAVAPSTAGARPPGPCQAKISTPAAPPATAAAAPSGRIRPNPDGPPNWKENHAWQERPALSPSDLADATAAAHKIRPAMESLCVSGDFSDAAAKQALRGLGFATERLELLSSQSRPGVPPAAGLGYSLGVGGRGCVAVAVRPGHVSVTVEGRNRDGACLEAFSH